MVTSAWWVEAHQVSKTAPSGEYLTVGSFMVRGKKNFLPPSQLEMGLGVLFRVSDDDLDGLARHKDERRDFAVMALEEEDAAEESDREGLSGITSSDKKQQVATAVDEMDNAEPLSASVSSGGNSTDVSPHGNLSLPEDNVRDSEIDEDGDGITLDVGGVSVNSGDAASSLPKKGLSVRDRKLIRKYGSLEKAELALGDQPKDATDGETKAEAPLPESSSASARKPLSRGKKAKLKRAVKKYGDQDEEDRELAMLALQGGEKKTKKGTGSKQQPQATETQLKVAEETIGLLQKDSTEAALALPEEVRSILSKCVTVKGNEGETVRWDKFDAHTLATLSTLDANAQIAVATRLQNIMYTTRIDNFSASLGGILRRVQKHGHENLNDEDTTGDKAKRKTKNERDDESVQWKQALAAEGVAIDGDGDEDAVDDTVELSKLTGKPQPDDLLLYAVAVCAPYQTLAQYTYRVKLTPGNMKRGKAAKQCVDMFLKQDGAKGPVGSDRYQSLIKKVVDNDWLQAICPDVKISAPGASKIMKQQKASAKKKKK
jgi:hypothetical protein